ncbi:MAG TPA: transglutaminase-like domain-containing protein, partial [Gemmatimonadales bacterium]|nr:transglutaminase-like domain-containing protein [Gemmatimonadales bacterium]
RSLASARRIPDTTATERHILVRRDSAALGGLPVVAAGGRQEVRGDTIIVRRRTPPDSGAPPPEGLFPSADVPIGLQGVGRTARRILAEVRGRRGAGPTRADTAAALTRWVARQIATDTAPGTSGSVALALRAGRGSPDAKARLLASLARTAQIPARVVSGLAVLPQGSFTHSWTELWVDGWVAADPTFGQYPASASLVRLTTGGRSRPVDLVPLAASAQFLPLPPVR